MNRLICCLAALFLLVSCAPEEPSKAPSLALDYHGVTLTVGMAEEEALAALGDGYTLSEAESCAGEGVDRMYTYPSMRLYVFAPGEGSATVSSVSYTDDGVETNGMRIGSTADEVRAALGEPDEASESALIYRREAIVLRVTLRDGRASDILLTGK